LLTNKYFINYNLIKKSDLLPKNQQVRERICKGYINKAVHG